ncbi:MAG TPA: hypothetical protein VJ890_24975 [Vineibacter sp.]|nr:hypothetical protein [Vineibacter sp.]
MADVSSVPDKDLDLNGERQVVRNPDRAGWICRHGQWHLLAEWQRKSRRSLSGDGQKNNPGTPFGLTVEKIHFSSEGLALN